MATSFGLVEKVATATIPDECINLPEACWPKSDLTLKISDVAEGMKIPYFDLSELSDEYPIYQVGPEFLRSLADWLVLNIPSAMGEALTHINWGSKKAYKTRVFYCVEHYRNKINKDPAFAAQVKAQLGRDPSAMGELGFTAFAAGQYSNLAPQRWLEHTPINNS